MSKFSIPEHFMPDVKQFEEMSREINALLPKELAGAVNLMAHPAAGVVAASALGIGVASHAFGVWMGTLAGIADASQRLFALAADEIGPDTAVPGRRTPSGRARAAANALIADAREAVKELAEQAGAKLVEESGAGAGKAAQPVAAVGTAADLMPEEFRQPRPIDKPDAPDDLKRITGIGPKLEAVLNGLGVWTYGQIAAWSSQEIAWVDDYLAFKGRIGRDDWIGQATKLAAGGTNH